MKKLILIILLLSQNIQAGQCIKGFYIYSTNIRLPSKIFCKTIDISYGKMYGSQCLINGKWMEHLVVNEGYAQWEQCFEE